MWGLWIECWFDIENTVAAFSDFKKYLVEGWVNWTWKLSVKTLRSHLNTSVLHFPPKSGGIADWFLLPILLYAGYSMKLKLSIYFLSSHFNKKNLTILRVEILNKIKCLHVLYVNWCKKKIAYKNNIFAINNIWGQSWCRGTKCDCKTDWLWVRSPLEEMKYLLKFIFILWCRGKAHVEFCHSTRNDSRIRRKVGNEVS